MTFIEFVLIIFTILLAVTFSGCLTDTPCPSDYEVLKLDRIRCYKNFDMGVDCNGWSFTVTEIVHGVPNKVCKDIWKKREVDCPLACVEAIQ